MNLTIITACWRAENLPKVYSSVHNQSYQDWHHIFINDNNPEVREMFKDHCDGVRTHWIDLGVRTHFFGAIARDIGVITAFCYVHHSKRDIDNEWVVFHDDDNSWEPNHLQSMVDAATADPEASLVASDAVWVGKNDPTWREIRPCRLRQGAIDLGQLMYKTALFRKYGYFFPHPRRKQKYDWELISKMAQNEKLIYTKQPTFIMSYRKK